MSRIALSRTTQVDCDPRAGTVFFVGTATVLFRLGGYTILTDPNFLHQGDHVHLGYGLVAKRLTEPALEIDQLPPLDLVVLSHYHGDQSVEITKPGAMPLTITAMPGQHGPSAVSWLLPPVMGSLLEFGDAPPFRLFISGDTLIHEEFRKIPERVRGIDLALLHLGGTRILGVYVTMDAAQGVEALRILDPAAAIPIHYDDYSVFKSPLEDFQQAVRAAGLEHRVHYLRHGETFQFRVAGEGRLGRAS